MSDVYITCPVTGRRFPAVKRQELKTCVACGALIDIRHEAWLDAPSHCPGRCPDPYPPAPVPVETTP